MRRGRVRRSLLSAMGIAAWPMVEALPAGAASIGLIGLYVVRCKQFPPWPNNHGGNPIDEAVLNAHHFL